MDVYMNILVVGLGSMGKRRARLIKSINPNAKIYGVDTTPSRRDEAQELGIITFESIESAYGGVASINCAFVCTAPLTHAKIIDELLEHSTPVFTELNLVTEGYNSLCEKAKAKNVPLFLSSTMLYRAETQYIKNEVVNFKKPVNYIYHIGQYLPDWHPWESYKNFFVGDARTNGVREIFAIDLPWLLDTFGEVESVVSQKDKLTDLEISYPDSIFVMLRHKNGTKGMLAVDVVSPKAVRNFEVFGEGLHVFWEGNPKALYKFNKQTSQKEFINTYESFEHDSRYSDNIVENAYVDEITNFFDVLNGVAAPKYSFEKDLVTLALIDKIEG